MVEDVTLNWFAADLGERGTIGPTPDEQHAADEAARSDGELVPVELRWKLGRCDREDCSWEGNPTPDPDEAEQQLAAHLEWHTEVEGE